MIKSMTGFGNAGYEDDRVSIHVEVKTLNSKFLDFSFRAPRQFSEKETEVRGLVQSILERGKVSLSLDYSVKNSNELPVEINKELFNNYYKSFQDLANGVSSTYDDLFRLALQSPNVMTSISSETADLDEDWSKIVEVIKEAVGRCNSFRSDEGDSLEEKLIENIEGIRQGLNQVKNEEGGRKDRIKNKIRGHFSEWLEEQSFDANRFEQELIYYFEKLDITEEIVRLETHLNYFTKCLKEDVNQGKKLGFISQEIGREINTIGSKANDAVMQKQVILMKDELEKIKEQSMNVL